MPKRTRTLPAYRKHRASGQAVVTLSGRDFYLGPHGSRASHLEYDRLTSEWLAAGRCLTDQRQDLTILELMASYWRHAEQHYVKEGRPTGEQGAIKAALRFLRGGYGKTQATEFGPLALKAVRQQMIDHGMARTTINANTHRIRRMFRWAAAEEMIPESTYRALTLVEGLKKGRTEARETSPVLPVDDATVDRTLEELTGVVADMVRLQRLTGMRPSEVCQMRPRDLNCSGEVWIYRLASHKTEHHDQEHIVFIGPKAQQILIPYLNREADVPCFSPAESEASRRQESSKHHQVQTGCEKATGPRRKPKRSRPPGDAYTSASYRRAIHRACDKAGVDRWSPNRLRHSLATRVRAQYGLEAAQVVLGHSGADVTQIYAERNISKGFEVAREIG